MDALECIRARRSIKKFLTKPVEFEKITLILEAGHHAPSAGNLQNWRFVVVTDKNMIRALPPACLNQTSVIAPIVIIVCAQNDSIEKEYGLRGSRLYSIQNCAAAIENMMLAACSLGLGMNWIGAFDENKIGAMFGIPDEARAQAILPLGYPSEPPPPKALRDIADVVYFNQFGLKIKNVQQMMRDYADEIERTTAEAKEVVDQGSRRLQDHLKRIRSGVKDVVDKRSARRK
ncbi:MAG: nitroreductase family protein [Nanoarchaeota archaeon]